MKKSFVAIVLISIFISSCSDDRRSNFTTMTEEGDIILSESSKEILDDVIQGYYDCHEKSDSKKECRYYVAEAIAKFYDINDFKKEDGSWDTYEEMVAEIKLLPSWERIGSASDQGVLDKARSLANDGRPTIAIESNKNTGHIALILPGPLKTSGSWSLDCPNSASFFRHKVEAYVNKPLSYSYRSPENIDIYSRK